MQTKEEDELDNKFGQLEDVACDLNHSCARTYSDVNHVHIYNQTSLGAAIIIHYAVLSHIKKAELLCESGNHPVAKNDLTEYHTELKEIEEEIEKYRQTMYDKQVESERIRKLNNAKR